MKRTLVLSFGAILIGACSGNSESGGLATGQQGGSSSGATGGLSSRTQATGGAVQNAAVGGQSAVAGGATAATTAGGGPSTISTVVAGGTTSSGGMSNRGGTSAASGGTSSATGGTKATGGTSSATGGTKATGGTSSATGGTKATGGSSSATGGTKATGGSSSATGGTTANGNGLLVPTNGALLGVFTPAQSQAEIATTESQIGRKWAIHLGYFDWSLDFTSFAQADIAAGRIPYVTVEPWNVTVDAIASGSQDSIIQARAASVKGLNGKVMLRFAHEMNGNWYPWDGYHNGANVAATAKYVAAYRHVHDVFVNAGVTNVLWVFCPNVDSVPGDAWNQWVNYYPGDAYVDWMCYDGYNWGTDTFAGMTSRIYSGLAAKNKPIMLGETSTLDVEKAAWINAVIPAMKSQFPLLKALVWFDVNKENDWRYDSSAASLSAFTTMAKDPYFNP